MIETIYRVTIHYDCDFEKIERIEAAIDRLKARDKIKSNQGGPAWNPFLRFECTTMAEASKVEGQLKRIIARNGGKEEE